MKPLLAILSDHISSEELFIAREIKLLNFSSEFHFHEECQLVYIANSAGKRIIGDIVDHFEKGELILLGSNIPHVWYNIADKESDHLHNLAHSLVLYFNPAKLVEYLASFCNIQKLHSFLTQAQRGIEFKGKTRNAILSKLKLVFKQDGIIQISSFLSLIDEMMKAKEYSSIASINYVNHFQYLESNRLSKVFRYIFDHFREDISLHTIAGIASMNSFAFCRFFKARTQKSFTQFLNETRIGYACKLLFDIEKSITEIAFECGFNNVSNFNRVFKLIKKQSPREFRKAFQNNP